MNRTSICERLENLKDYELTTEENFINDVNLLKKEIPLDYFYILKELTKLIPPPEDCCHNLTIDDNVPCITIMKSRKIGGMLSFLLSDFDLQSTEQDIIESIYSGMN